MFAEDLKKLEAKLQEKFNIDNPQLTINSINDKNQSSKTIKNPKLSTYN